MNKPLGAVAAIALLGTTGAVAVVATSLGGDDQSALQVETHARDAPTCDPQSDASVG